LDDQEEPSNGDHCQTYSKPGRLPTAKSGENYYGGQTEETQSGSYIVKGTDARRCSLVFS